ncbi:MAG TPA: aminopeptidase P family protein [Tissierellia bacterium]|jgi:Xaa-Pro aminopeptidase|nr:aminopeptidase P family protein [Tissierellia bacterium]
MDRVARVRKKMQQASLDAALFYKPENLYYLSGFTGSSGYVLITPTDKYFLTDFRYYSQVREQAPDFELVPLDYHNPIRLRLGELSSGVLGFEEEHMIVETYHEFKAEYKGELRPMGRFIEDLRMIKDEQEVATMQRAQDIADETYKEILEIVSAGMSELDLAQEMYLRMQRKGAQGTSFDTIVASGIRGSLPHGVASDKIMQRGELVTLDFGCIYNGYCSDMTRTFALGRADERQKEIYDIVLEAQLAALKVIAPGVSTKLVDKAARDVIAGYGYAEYFGHGLGHSLGLEVHENPRFSPLSDVPLEVGMVMTVEPGIYLEDFGGVRIEDAVVITEDGYHNMTRSPKELIEI